MNRLLPRFMIGSRPRGIPDQRKLGWDDGFCPELLELVPQGNEPPFGKICVSESPFHHGSVTQSPDAFAALIDPSPCQFSRHPQAHEAFCDRWFLLPVLQDNGPKPTPDVGIHTLENPDDSGCTYPEMTHPSLKIPVDLRDDRGQ